MLRFFKTAFLAATERQRRFPRSGLGGVKLLVPAPAGPEHLGNPSRLALKRVNQACDWSSVNFTSPFMANATVYGLPQSR